MVSLGALGYAPGAGGVGDGGGAGVLPWDYREGDMPNVLVAQLASWQAPKGGGGRSDPIELVRRRGSEPDSEVAN